MYNVNKYIFQSNYCGGLHILNGSIPVPMTSSDMIQEVGFFDMSASCSGAGAPWLGSWSNYPFFHSGNVAVSSIEMGLFVLRVSLTIVFITLCAAILCVTVIFNSRNFMEVARCRRPNLLLR